MTASLTLFLPLAFFVTVAGVFLLRPLAIRVGIVDTPGGRKHHNGDIPLVGGAAIYLAVVGGLLLTPFADWPVGAFIVVSSILLLVGVVDDAKGHTPPKLRLLIQGVAALIMVYGGGVELATLGRILDGIEVELGVLAIPFTVFAAVGFVNALNMIDGVDGLAGSVALTAAAGMAFFALRAGDMQSAAVLLLLGGGILGFLLFNWRFTPTRSARIFLGDAGTLFLGGSLCWFSIQLSQGDRPAMEPVTALWLFAVPLIDTVSMMIRRIWKGRSPFDADREHFHHILLAGLSERETVLLILAISVSCAGLGILGELYGVEQSLRFYLFLGFGLVHLFLLRHAWKVMRGLKAIRLKLTAQATN